MPALDNREQPLLCGRDMYFEFALYDEDEAPIALTINDAMDAWLSEQQGSEATLHIDSFTPLAGGSVIVIEELGSTGNPDPDDDVPASGYLYFGRDDTSTIPTVDEWEDADQEKLYWLDIAVYYALIDELHPCNRSRMRVKRSPFVEPSP
jgi:hypothetical protein